MDGLSKGLTIVISVMFIAVLLSNYFVYRSGQETPAILVTLLLVAVYVFSYLFRVTGYELNGQSLIIFRPIRNRVIPLTEILRVGQVEKKSLRWSLRTFGNGGLFGYYGKFYNPTFGTMTWYASRRSNALLMQTTNSENILITPDEPEAFLGLLAKNRSVASDNTFPGK